MESRWAEIFCPVRLTTVQRLGIDLIRLIVFDLRTTVQSKIE